MFKNLEKEKPYTIGLCQALGVTIYCGLVALFFNYLTQTVDKPGFYGFFFMMLLLVFSAAITGSLVFGFSVYLAVVKNKIKEALQVLAYTLIFSFAIIASIALSLITFLS